MKRMISLLLCALMLCGMITTVSAASELAGAVDYYLGTNATGYMATKNQTVVYKFYLATSDKISVNLYSDLPYLYAQLYDENGERFWSDSIYDNDTTKEIRYTKDFYLCTGTYYITLKNSSDLGSYDLKILENPIYESFQETQGGNNNSTKDSDTVLAGFSYTGCIALNDKTDIYRFELVDSGNMAFDLFANMPYVRAELFDENGKRIWYQSIYDNDTTKEIKFQKDLYLIRGLYYLSFSTSSDYGEYRFSFQFTPAGESHPESISDTNNQTATADGIDMNYHYHGQLALNDNTDIYYIYISSSNPTLNINGVIPYIRAELYDENGKRVWNRSIYDNDTTKEIRFSEAMKNVAPGVYYLSLHSSSDYGDYAFNVTDGGQIIEYNVAPATQQNPIINEVLNTDIRAYVDGYPIRSFNIDGYTAIVAEDLAQFGFRVVYNNDTRALYIDEGNKVITSTYQHIPNIMPVGSKAMDVYRTDIKTYSYGYEITGNNVNGYTIIYLDDLTAFGKTYWDPVNRTISFYRY